MKNPPNRGIFLRCVDLTRRQSFRRSILDLDLRLDPTASRDVFFLGIVAGRDTTGRFYASSASRASCGMVPMFILLLSHSGPVAIRAGDAFCHHPGSFFRNVYEASSHFPKRMLSRYRRRGILRKTFDRGTGDGLFVVQHERQLERLESAVCRECSEYVGKRPIPGTGKSKVVDSPAVLKGAVEIRQAQPKDEQI